LEGKRYDLAGEVIGAAMKVHRAPGPGFLESVSVNARTHEQAKAGLSAARETPLQVRYNGVIVDNYIADLVIGDSLIVEVKAVQALAKAHETQLVNYLAATGIDTGLLRLSSKDPAPHAVQFR
jgi:hypothetical protein